MEVQNILLAEIVAAATLFVMSGSSLKRSPEGGAGFLSRMFFYWMSGLVSGAKKQVLELVDVPDLSDVDRAARFSDKFDKAWENELAVAKREKRAPRLNGAIRKTFGTEFVKAGLFKLIHDLLNYSTPVVITLILESIEKEAATSTDGSEAGSFSISSETAAYGIALFGIKTLQALFLNNYFHRTYRIGMNVRSFIITGIFAKAMRLSPAAHTMSSGEIQNLVSNDATRIMKLAPYLHNLWSAPLQVIIGFTELYVFLGPSALVGVLVMMLVVPTKLRLAKVLQRLRKVVVGFTDKRVKIISDLVHGIRVVKYYAWEKSFSITIGKTRADELSAMTKHIIVELLNFVMWNLTPLLVSLFTFGVFALAADGEMKASIIFPALTLFRLIRFPIIVLPFIITMLANFNVASKRISVYLQNEEIDDEEESQKGAPGTIVIEDASFSWDVAPSKEERETKTKDGAASSKKAKHSAVADASDVNIDVSGVTDEGRAKDDVAFRLEKISFSVRPGELVAVIGKGSWKVEPDFVDFGRNAPKGRQAHYLRHCGLRAAVSLDCQRNP